MFRDSGYISFQSKQWLSIILIWSIFSNSFKRRFLAWLYIRYMRRKSDMSLQARIQGMAYRAYPPLKLSKIWYSDGGIYTFTPWQTVNSYVTITYLSLISDLISIMQTLLGSSDLLRWWNHNSKGPNFSTSAVYLTESLRARILTFFTQVGKIDIISLPDIVHSKWGFA